MSVEKELQDAFANLAGRKLSTFPAEVLEVDKAKGICKVKAKGLDYTKVRLASVIDENENKVFLFPKVGSWVLVSPILEDIHNLQIEAYSEIEEYYLNIEKTKFRITKDGYLISRDGETLKEVLNDFQDKFGELCDEVCKIVVSIGTTPNVPAIQQIKLEVIQNLKNRTNKILTDGT